MTALLGESGTSFEHEALLYRGEDDFLAGLLPFVREGLERDEAVVVAEPAHRLTLLRDALGDDAPAVTFLDMAEVGANPSRIIGVWATALDEHVQAGRRLRGVGEPAFSGRRDPELVECELHEQLLNHAFGEGPAWRLLCPYDELSLPAAVCRRALRTHPIRSTTADRRASEAYAAHEWTETFAAGLPRPTEAVLRGVYGPGDVPATRRTVAQYARSVGLRQEQVEVLALAASELATNSIRHGGGSGTVALWTEPGAAVVEFSDSGHLPDPLGRRRRGLRGAG